MITEFVELESTAFFGFGTNDASGQDDADSTPVFDVRESGATAADAPTFSGNCTLLSNAGYPLGCYEVAVACTAANGFAADTSYLVYVTATVNTVGYTSCVGAIKTSPLTTAKDLGQMLKTTVSGVTSQTVFVLTAGSGDNDAYNNCQVTFEDSDGDMSVRRVTDYVGSTKTLTIDSGPAFTVATTDTVRIHANTSPGQIAGVQTGVTAIEADTVSIETKVDTIDGIVDSILVDTGTTIPATIATVDTNVDAILVDTGTTLPASLTAIETDTQDIQTRIPAALSASGNMESNISEVNGTEVTGSGEILDPWQPV